MRARVGWSMGRADPHPYPGYPRKLPSPDLPPYPFHKTALACQGLDLAGTMDAMLNDVVYFLILMGICWVPILVAMWSIRRSDL